MLSRRSFLQGVLASSAGLMLPGTVEAYDRGEVLATLLDLSKCVGCGECVSACKEVNKSKFPVPKKPFPKMYPSRVKVADWSDKQDVDDRLTPYNWLFIQTATGTWQGKEFEINIPRRCLHCLVPPCANLCPWGACLKQKNGIVRINADICLGGSKCKSVCPWHIPERQTGVGLYLKLLPSYAGNGVMYKCDRCYDKIAQGKVPACIEVCPEGVQIIGPRDEIIAKAHELAKKMNGYIYGEYENGGTNTIYVSPVPFEVLNKCIEKGPGKPHLDKVPYSMDKEEYLGQAVLTAPVVGLLAGVLTVLSKFKKDEGEN
ncbi:MAG: 4Fe-4S dicluster domain-containing protein [Desulfonauticus sp.]|nr:4Fe-4S dicluster domain-containing protein [Desulfonauticus sp.]